MLRYVFDASAVVEYYIPRRDSIRRAFVKIISQREAIHEAVFFVPAFCIPEVFNTFARFHFDPKPGDPPLDRAAYERMLKSFRHDVRWGRLFYPYELSRYHVMAADEIIPIEHTVARRSERDHLSTFDILLIAMACEMAYIGPRDNVFLVTCDSRIQTVCTELRSLRLNRKTVLKIPRLLDEPESSRWFPPQVLYLPALKVGDIPSPFRAKGE